MFDLNTSIENEKKLERKYQGVIGYVESKDFLEKTGYTSGKIRGALTRYCKEHEVERPGTFIEMESFVIDFVDWWLDENIEIHKYGELKLHDAVSNYLAFVDVWKAKSKSLSIYTPELMKQVGMMLIVKNTLSHAVKIGYSYAKRNPELKPEELKDGFLLGFAALLPTVAAIHSGEIELPANFDSEGLTRLIGAYLAGDKQIEGIVKSLNQIEEKGDL
jgi:hypothetical protein